MKKILIMLMLIASFGTLVACGSNDHIKETGDNSYSDKGYQTITSKETGDNSYSDKGYQTITAEEAMEMMEKNDSYILLDVRTEEEFSEGHIEGAILIPDYELKEQAETKLPDKDALILIYCRSGRRSALAAKDLSDMGYTQVYDFGGIINWPYDTISE